MRRLAVGAIVGLVLLLCGAEATAATLVVNGGFETPQSTAEIMAGVIPGWTITGDGVGLDQVFVNSGNYDAIFTAPSDSNPGILSQDLVTIPGASYVLNFAVLDEAGIPTDNFGVNFGGFSTTINGTAAAAPGDLPSSYTALSFVIPAADITSASTSLSFQGLNDPVFGQAWNLDDVSVTSTIPDPAIWMLMLAGVSVCGASLRLSTKSRLALL